LGLERISRKKVMTSRERASAPGDVFPYVDFEHPAFILCQLFVGSPPACRFVWCMRVRCRYLSIHALSASIIPSTTLLVPLFSPRSSTPLVLLNVHLHYRAAITANCRHKGAFREMETLQEVHACVCNALNRVFHRKVI
jgi:hypothetical protein